MRTQSFHQHLAPGEVLFRQGENGDVAYVIESGAVEIYAERSDGEQSIARLRTGDLFGEMALLGDRQRTASARALESTQLMVVSPEALQERIQTAEPLLRHLLHTVVYRASDMLGWVRSGQMGRSVLSDDDDASSTPSTVADRNEALRRIKLEQDLALALQRREFVLHYQPILCLKSGRVAGFESLIRWIKPGVGRIPPNDFIPVAEESGLINEIGRWILDTAVQDLATLAAAAGRDVFVSVNLSGRQLVQPDLIDQVLAVLPAVRSSGGRLKLEITESLMVGDTPRVSNFVRRCRELGIEVLIDDFGTGYSSLSYLHHFPVHTMKLDRSFLTDLGSSAASAVILNNMARMAHELGLDVVLEGIETAGQALQARELGIDYGQGWHFGKAVELAEARQLLAAAGPA